METVTSLITGVGFIFLSLAMYVQNNQIQRLQNEIKLIKNDTKRKEVINYVK